MGGWVGGYHPKCWVFKQFFAKFCVFKPYGRTENVGNHSVSLVEFGSFWTHDVILPTLMIIRLDFEAAASMRTANGVKTIQNRTQISKQSWQTPKIAKRRSTY